MKESQLDIKWKHKDAVLDPEKVESNHRRYLERLEVYRREGYDIVESHKKLVDAAEPLEGKILEIGTGKGHLALEIAKRGYELTSIDISAQELEMARLNLAHAGLLDKVSLLLCDAGSTGFAPNSFDTVISYNALHHLENAHRIFNEIIRIVKIKAKVVFAEYSAQGFAIIERIHEREGKVHTTESATIQAATSFFTNEGFSLRTFSIPTHEMAILERENQSQGK